MDNILDLINIASDCSSVILCITSIISIFIIRKQLKTSNTYNFLEMEYKLIQLKNKIDTLENRENNTNSTNSHFLMYMMSNGNIDANELYLNQNNAQIIEKNNQIYKEKLINNYYLAADTMAFLVLRNKEKKLQNKYYDIINDVYEKIKDNEKSKRTYSNIIKFVEEIQPKTLA